MRLGRSRLGETAGASVVTVAAEIEYRPHMGKIFLLDTNVLSDLSAIYGFPGEQVILPIYVVEELDQFKKGVNGLGRNARRRPRTGRSKKKERATQRWREPDNGGSLRVAFLGDESAPSVVFAVQYQYDNLILRCAGSKQNPDHDVVLVTKDTNLRIRADVASMQRF